ncbi:hypothetical protein pW2_158 [Bacillus phage pW2]|uniref:Uncharacterized protein n=1 Tax=Bacillus phage pW2 TaxID=2500559 RepID=A0A3Q9R7I1_9CAUD|nr:hypothetical protein PQE69_gp135 [Bacillus phage pW2]AZU98983.1 hypothetical protein pW2_158 [Bacillus phage pW2]
MCMIVNVPKANLEGIKALHNYLYDLTEPNYEVLELYKQIDDEVDELETEIAEMKQEENAEEELQEIKQDVKRLMRDADKKDYTSEQILEALEQILF